VSDSRFDTEYTDFPICPACGYEHKDWECEGEGDSERWCESCDQPILVETHVYINYTTTAREEAPRDE